MELTDEIYEMTEFNKIRQEIIKSLYDGNWLYYCYNTPIWKERIIAHGGIIDNKLKKIVFNHKKGDEFYGKYDYEPDNNMYIIKYIAGEKI
jgi:hypothetical protein